MTVKDLIELLTKCDRDAEVFIRGDEIEEFSLAKHVYELDEVEIRSFDRSEPFQEDQVFLVPQDSDRIGTPCVVLVARK